MVRGLEYTLGVDDAMNCKDFTFAMNVWVHQSSGELLLLGLLQ